MFVLWHCGPAGIEPEFIQRMQQVRFYERPVAEVPETTFILGHSGCLQWEEALRLARTYPNVWLELSSQSLSSLRRILEEAPVDRLVYGSDWPFYHQCIALAKIFIATEGDEPLRRKVLYENAARLLGPEGDDGA
jgi:predicted TIM-barrel fold metal-dependent hydrolase